MATSLVAASDLERRRAEYMAVINDPNKSEAAKTRAKVGMLDTSRESVAKATSREIAKRVIDQAIQLLREKPELEPVDVQSLMTCVYRAAMLDLRLGGLRPEAYVIPIPKRAKRNGEWVTIRTDANLWPSYHGWTSLVRRTDRMGREPIVSSVFEGEDFSATLEDGVTICRHKADALNENRRSGDDSKITYVWVRWTIDGRPVDFLMSRAELEAHKTQYSKKPHAGEWNWDTKWREMAEKTVIIVSVRRGHVPACFDLAEVGFADEDAAIEPMADLGVLDGECSPAAESDDHALIEPQGQPADADPPTALGAETLREVFARFESRLAQCKTTAECNQLWESFFGDRVPHAWDDSDRGLSNELRAKRVEQLRQA